MANTEHQLNMLMLLLLSLGAYLIGSIPFGLLLTRLAGHGDIRQIGSGNIGATNVLRTGSKALALATLLLDFAKAFVPLWLVSTFYKSHIAQQLLYPHDASEWMILLCAALILGHMFPIWLKFKGGKGVACIFGIGFALSTMLGWWLAICWLTVFAISRYSSLSAIIGLPAGALIAAQNPAMHYEPLVLALPLLLMISRHRENIARLLKGQEHRFSFAKKEDA